MPSSEWRIEDPIAGEPEYQACPRCSDVYQVALGHACEPTQKGESPTQNGGSDVKVDRSNYQLGGSPTTDVLAHWELASLAAPGYLGTREEVQDELDDIARCVRSFHVKPPDMVMRESAAYSARLTELAVLLHRQESHDRQYTRIRTQQVERFLTEIDRQFKVASRLLEAQRQDLELLR